MLSRRLSVWCFAVALLLGSVSSADAASIVFNLNCRFQGDEESAVNHAANQCAPGGSFGTVTMTDHVAPDDYWIDILVDLAAPTANISKLYFNLPPAWNLDPSKTIVNGVEQEWSATNGVTVIPNDKGPQNQPNGSCDSSLDQCDTYRKEWM